MKRFRALLLLLPLFLAGNADAKKSAGSHYVRSYVRKDGTFVRGHMRGTGSTFSRRSSRRSSNSGRINGIKISDALSGNPFDKSLLTPKKPPHLSRPAYDYTQQQPTLEPSWIRQQRLERAAGLTPTRKQEVTSIGTRCIAVLDGQTLKVSRAGQEIIVTLYGIKSPALKERFGEESRQHLSRLVLNKPVTLYPVKNAPTGAYWVFVGDKGINAAQIETGYAYWNGRSAPHETKLAVLENQAKAARVGIWKEQNLP